jgi:hypothetical protein
MTPVPHFSTATRRDFPPAYTEMTPAFTKAKFGCTKNAVARLVHIEKPKFHHSDSRCGSRCGGIYVVDPQQVVRQTHSAFICQSSSVVTLFPLLVTDLIQCSIEHQRMLGIFAQFQIRIRRFELALDPLESALLLEPYFPLFNRFRFVDLRLFERVAGWLLPVFLHGAPLGTLHFRDM